MTTALLSAIQLCTTFSAFTRESEAIKISIFQSFPRANIEKAFFSLEDLVFFGILISLYQLLY